MSELLAPPGWRDRLEVLGGRRRDTAIVGALVALLVFGGLGVWSRGAPRASIAPPARASASPAPSSSGTVVVHVAGAVRRPGIYELPPGSRVADAIELAGGVLPRADLDLLNLAALLVDGSQIFVGNAGATAPPAQAPTLPSGPPVVDLNTADQHALETIPGVGPVTAAAILQHRTEIGTFTSIDQLLDVSGIGPATLEAIRPYIAL